MPRHLSHPGLENQETVRTTMEIDVLISRKVNHWLGGNAKETICSRVARKALFSRRWEWVQMMIDSLHTERNHCWRSHLRFLKRKEQGMARQMGRCHNEECGERIVLSNPHVRIGDNIFCCGECGAYWLRLAQKLIDACDPHRQIHKPHKWWNCH